MTTSLSEPHRRAAAFVLQIAPVCLAGTNLCGVSGTFTVARIVNTSFVCFERPPRRGHSAPPFFLDDRLPDQTLVHDQMPRSQVRPLEFHQKVVHRPNPVGVPPIGEVPPEHPVVTARLGLRLTWSRCWWSGSRPGAGITLMTPKNRTLVRL